MIVIARSVGRLGNHLELYAHFIAAAREYGVTLANPCFAEYADCFVGTKDDPWCRYPTREHSQNKRLSLGRRRVQAKATYLAARTLAHLRLRWGPAVAIRLKGESPLDLGSEAFASMVQRHPLLFVQGWCFRCSALLAKHADAVRRHLQITDEHRLNVDRTIEQARADSDFLVGVHVRHGDYATWKNGQHFYPLAKYAGWMRQIVKAFPDRNVRFMVCSEKPLDLELFAGLHVRFGPGHPVEDMYSLADTDLILGPPSTFTIWASFYGETPLMVLEHAEQRLDREQLQRLGRSRCVA